MTFGDLLQQSRLAYEKQPNQVEKVANRQLFAEGGHWMAQKMNELSPQKAITIDHYIPFNRYGFFKYGLCLSAFLMSFCLFAHYNVALIPLSVLVFYFLEIHFVFLFPLLIDKVPDPLWASIKMTYKIGIFKTLLYVLRIAGFMLVGLFYFKNPLKNWHIGCLFIIIWYQHEIRNDETITYPFWLNPFIPYCPSFCLNSTHYSHKKILVWTKRFLPKKSMLLFHRSLEIGYKSHFETRTERYWIQDGVSFTVLYLSDFHFNGFSWHLLAEIIQEVDKINPTIILLGGDYADTRQGLSFFEQLLQSLTQRPNVFAIAGNHDYFWGITKIKNLCDQYRIGWIEKGSVCVDIDGFKVQIVGKTPQKALPDAHFNILCLHEPVDISALTTSFDLVFAGHLHGCQVVFWETEKGLFPGKLFYRWNILKTQIGSCLYLVSKGLGDTLPLRWNCKRDIVLVEVINK